MKRVAFLTTVFPVDQNCINDFFDSLQEQTYTNYDLVVVNDGYGDMDILLKKYSNLKIIELKHSSTPAKNREYGINYIIENNYDIAILGDIDDRFSENRIEESVKALNSHDIVVNDLTTFKEDVILTKRYLSNRLKNNTIIDLNFIEDKNIMGFSNSAFNVKSIKKVKFPTKIIAVDWYFFSILLLSGLRGIFINTAETFYRQHNSNIIGLEEDNNIDHLKHIYNIKYQHYKELSSFEQFRKRFESFKTIDVEKIKSYCNNIKKPLWWEKINN